MLTIGFLAEQLTLLRTLVVWALGSSDAVQNLVKESYKQVRHEDDRNQPLSVQAWGRDGYKRKYWLIEGQDDTHFRLYREANGVDPKAYQWFSVAGNIDEVRSVAERLDEEGTSHARTLRDRIRAAIPRFECGEEVGDTISSAAYFANATSLEKEETRLPSGTKSCLR